MGPLRELIAIDHRQALEFFFQRLQDVSGLGVDRQELLYNASVLAHYAQVSTQAGFELSPPANLSAVFDCFIFEAKLAYDGPILETVGAQCLLLTGFFEDQMRRRHNIRWYAEIGAAFYSRAAVWEPSPEKARLLDAIAGRFETWRQRHSRLGRELSTAPFLLTPPKPPPPLVP